jgi:hypothetical protein
LASGGIRWLSWPKHAPILSRRFICEFHIDFEMAGFLIRPSFVGEYLKFIREKLNYCHRVSSLC